jgi:hypothetical protein
LDFRGSQFSIFESKDLLSSNFFNGDMFGGMGDWGGGRQGDREYRSNILISITIHRHFFNTNKRT